ncbi:MAG: DeoR family transcriptional regulator [Candidatus Paceibacterota bacterium]
MNKKFTELAKDVYRLTVLFPTREPLRYKLREVCDDIVAEIIMERNDYFGNIRRNLELVYSYLDIALEQNWVSPAQIGQVRDNYGLAARELTEMKMAREIAAGAAIKNEMNTRENEKESVCAPDFDLASQEVEVESAFAPKKDLMEVVPPAKPMIVELPAEGSKTGQPKKDAVAEKILPVVPMPSEAPDADNGPEEDENEDEGGEDEEKSGLSAGQVARQNRIAEFLKANGNAQVWEIQKVFPSVSKRTIRRDFRSMLKQGLIERTGERNTTAYKLKIILS